MIPDAARWRRHPERTMRIGPMVPPPAVLWAVLAAVVAVLAAAAVCVLGLA